MKTGMKKVSLVMTMFLAAFIMMLMFSKPVYAATFVNTVYYDAAKDALKQAAAESGVTMQMDADLNKLALQLAVDQASGTGYDFEVGLPRRIAALQKATNNYKSWMSPSSGFIYDKGIADVQKSIKSSLAVYKDWYSDYNLVGLAIIENANTKKNNCICYMIIIGKGTCKPETKTGVKTETIKSGAAVSFTDSSSGSSSSSKVKVTALKIEGASKTLLTGKKMTLKAVATPSNAADKSVTWSVSNKNYASISSSGVVTAKTAGAGKTVTITAKAKDGSGKKATYKIKIAGAVKKISLKVSGSVTAGKSVTVKATVSVGAGGSKALTWSSSNTKYATVNAKGVVVTKKAGKGKTVTITAKAKDGSGKKASVKIKIK